MFSHHIPCHSPSTVRGELSSCDKGSYQASWISWHNMLGISKPPSQVFNFRGREKSLTVRLVLPRDIQSRASHVVFALLRRRSAFAFRPLPNVASQGFFLDNRISTCPPHQETGNHSIPLRSLPPAGANQSVHTPQAFQRRHKDLATPHLMAPPVPSSKGRKRAVTLKGSAQRRTPSEKYCIVTLKGVFNHQRRHSSPYASTAHTAAWKRACHSKSQSSESRSGDKAKNSRFHSWRSPPCCQTEWLNFRSSPSSVGPVLATPRHQNTHRGYLTSARILGRRPEGT